MVGGQREGSGSHRLKIGAVIALVLLSNGALAQGRFRGTDGKFDTTKFLASRGGFLPVPLVVTEPAIGFGGGLGAIFFRPDPDRVKGASARPAPPTMFAVFGIG